MSLGPYRLLFALAAVTLAAPTAVAGDEPGNDEVKDEVVPTEDAASSATDVAHLRQEYLRLRDQLFRSRARAAAIASALYSTKLTLDLGYTSSRFYTVARATIRLDGANVFDDTDGVISKDAAPRFEGYIAPGRHVLSIRIEAIGKDDDRFTSIIDNTFTLQAPSGKDVHVVAKARDGGDIPYAWSRDESGTYNLVLDVKVKTAERPQPTQASKPSTKSEGHGKAR